jgi:hypothetical protein
MICHFNGFIFDKFTKVVSFSHFFSANFDGVSLPRKKGAVCSGIRGAVSLEFPTTSPKEPIPPLVAAYTITLSPSTLSSNDSYISLLFKDRKESLVK